jgi:hypothetical protein
VNDCGQGLGFVDLLRESPHRVAIGKVTDQQVSTPIDTRLKLGGSIAASSVDDDLVAGSQQRFGCQPAESLD